MPVTPAIVVTCDLDKRSIVVSGDTPEFRKNLSVRIVDSDLPAVSAIVLLLYRNTYVGACQSFAVDGDDLVGTVSLNTIPLEAAFSGRSAQAIIPLALRVYDTGIDAPIAYGKVSCLNNLPSGFDIPTAVDPTEYMQLLTYDADQDGVIDDAALPPRGNVYGPAGATAGNLAALDATGKVISDSGSKPADFAPLVHYHNYAVLNPTEYVPSSVPQFFPVDYSAEKLVQRLGTLDLTQGDSIILSKGDGWPASGNSATVLLELTIDTGDPGDLISGGLIFPGDWVQVRTNPGGSGVYLITLTQIGGVIYFGIDSTSSNQMATEQEMTAGLETGMRLVSPWLIKQAIVALSPPPPEMDPITPSSIGAATAAQGAKADTAIQPQRPFTSTAVDLTITDAMEFVEVTVAGRTVTLPDPAGRSGKPFTVDNGSTGDVYAVTAAGTIEGETRQTIPPNSAMSVYSDGAMWRFY